MKKKIFLIAKNELYWVYLLQKQRLEVYYITGITFVHKI